MNHKKTLEERLKKPCVRGHPLEYRYTNGKDGKNLRCRLCRRIERRKEFPAIAQKLSPTLLAMLADKPLRAKQLSRLLHVKPNAIYKWLNGKAGTWDWRKRQIIAAIEMGLIANHIYTTNGSLGQNSSE